MDISVTGQPPDAVEVRVRGDVDIANVAVFAEALYAVVAVEPASITLALDEATFISAHGVQVLLDTANLADEHRVALQLGPCSRMVRRALRVCAVSTEQLPSSA